MTIVKINFNATYACIDQYVLFILQRRSVTATELDIAELADLDQDMIAVGASYTDMVDVQDIADAVSVSEGSIMSIIDWDQVDQLIAEVH